MFCHINSQLWLLPCLNIIMYSERPYFSLFSGVFCYCNRPIIIENIILNRFVSRLFFEERYLPCYLSYLPEIS